VTVSENSSGRQTHITAGRSYMKVISEIALEASGIATPIEAYCCALCSGPETASVIVSENPSGRQTHTTAGRSYMKVISEIALEASGIATPMDYRISFA